MPWLLLVLMAADAPQVPQAAMRLQGSSGRLQVAASRIAQTGERIAQDGHPHSLGPVASDLVVLQEQLSEVERHVRELEAALSAVAPR